MSRPKVDRRYVPMIEGPPLKHCIPSQVEQLEAYCDKLEAENKQLQQWVDENSQKYMDAKVESNLRGKVITKLKADKQELIVSYEELLMESKYLYGYFPNSFRNSVEQYFKEETDILTKHKDN